MLYAAGASILGLQLVIFSLIARAIGYVKGLFPSTRTFGKALADRLPRARHRAGPLDRAVGLGLAVRSVSSVVRRAPGRARSHGDDALCDSSVTLMIAGAEIVFASFVLSFIEPFGGSSEPRAAV